MLYVGTCGYSYADWAGPFYPPTAKPREMLGLYARRFSAVEIDSTYYRIPGAKTFAAMARATPPGFRFCAKLPGTLTHLASRPAPALEDAKIFREAIEPLVGARKFACALMQFPHGFEPTDRNIEHVRALRAAFDDLALVTEFRNRAWQTPATIALLGELGVGWCNVDEPQFPTLLRPGADATSTIGYVRFHGRNAAKWWKHERPEERYDYLYRDDELDPWAKRVADLAADPRVRETYAFFNNHRRGQAPRNAEQFEALLHGLVGDELAQAEAEPFAEQLRLVDDYESR